MRQSHRIFHASAAAATRPRLSFRSQSESSQRGVGWDGPDQRLGWRQGLGRGRYMGRETEGWRPAWVCVRLLSVRSMGHWISTRSRLVHPTPLSPITTSRSLGAPVPTDRRQPAPYRPAALTVHVLAHQLLFVPDLLTDHVQGFLSGFARPHPDMTTGPSGSDFAAPIDYGGHCSDPSQFISMSWPTCRAYTTG